MANQTELLKACEALGINTEGLNTNAKLKAALDAHKAKNAAEALKKHQTNNPSVFKSANGAKYRFKKTAPKMLRVDGVARDTKDLINDKEIMLELISGNNNFVERIN